jgi:diguanylate cyclase (GGDEF)-like protein/PAS domain S-box-containing protein
VVRAIPQPLLRVLFLHDDVVKVERCRQELRSVQLGVTDDVARTADQLSRLLRLQTYDLVLAEYPSSICPDADRLLRRLQTDKPIPVIFLADALPRETQAELIAKGAAACIDVSAISHLPVAIRRALAANRLRDERDRAERQFRHAESHDRALVGNLAYGMCRCDLTGTLLDANTALVTMLGYPSREALLGGNLVGDIVRDPRRRARLLGHVAKGEHADPVETEWRRRDGTFLRIRLSGREVRNGEGQAQGYELIAEDIARPRDLEEHLRQQAARDPLTGLANYRHLATVLNSEIKRTSRTGREFALLLLDVDGLKQINDCHGHVVGSQALCRVADALCILSRDTDTVARLGGDEFALVLPETGREGAERAAERIQDRLATDRREPRITVRTGVAVHPRDGGRIDTLLSAADAAMYSAPGSSTAEGARATWAGSSAIHLVNRAGRR